MKIIAPALFALVLAPAAAQDAAEPRPPSFTFSVEQGWSITADAELDFPDIQETTMQEDLRPRFCAPATRPTFPWRDRDNHPRPRPRGSRVFRTSRDPLKLEGSIQLHPDGTFRPQFRRIEYWDRSQRYWIEVQDDKVRTHELGGLEKWTGTRAEWSARLEKLETAFLDAYLKALTPQPPARGGDRLGLEIAASPDPAWRLFAVTSLEEQLAALLLARIDGSRVGVRTWPAAASRYPDRPQELARGLFDRILAQAEGSFAPEPARARPGRTIKDAAWQGTEIAIPNFRWLDGRAWAEERLKPVEEARARLRALADESNRGNGIEPDLWRNAVEDEAKRLRKLIPVASPERAATIDDALLPRIRRAGPATYDFHEKTELREERIVASDADVHGFARDLEVFYFQSGQNVWKTSVIQLETWYKAKVKRD